MQFIHFRVELKLDLLVTKLWNYSSKQKLKKKTNVINKLDLILIKIKKNKVKLLLNWNRTLRETNYYITDNLLFIWDPNTKKN